MTTSCPKNITITITCLVKIQGRNVERLQRRGFIMRNNFLPILQAEAEAEKEENRNMLNAKPNDCIFGDLHCGRWFIYS